MESLTLVFSDAATTRVRELLAAEERKGLALRLAIDGITGGTFRYQLGFVGPEERRADDQVVDGGGFDVFVDSKSAADLAGASIDFVDTLEETGFRIDNPNSPWKDPLAAQVAQVIEHEINPAVASHGGWVALVGVEDGVAYLEMGGGCQGCGMAKITLRQGIEVRLKEAVPAIREIVDVTDHAGGTNPFYTGEGRSPLG
ncbi:MAG TPA: iron-sulfur cluster assembly accessory protein [Dongiaceae bacterium]|nr:iron-sulfur cluster assembly accessory protein [Dongiaceae bacterium]